MQIQQERQDAGVVIVLSFGVRRHGAPLWKTGAVVRLSHTFWLGRIDKDEDNAAAMAVIRATEADFAVVGANILGRTIDPRIASHTRTHKAHFGESPLVAAEVWNRCVGEMMFDPVTTMKKHFLWAFCLKHTCGTESVMSTVLKCDPKTLRKHAWPLVKAIADCPGTVSISVDCLSWPAVFEIHLFDLKLILLVCTHRLFGKTASNATMAVFPR